MRITRRKFVAASAAITAAAILPSRFARAADFEYKMGHSSPESHPFHKRLLEVSDRISKETAGKMKLNIFPRASSVAITICCPRPAAARWISSSPPA
jgi:TRAP-type C4-dicarboxylate transport system substrate-binding protein